MGEIDVKKVAIAVALIVIICLGVLVLVRNINNDNSKKYTLEQIAEEDYKFFTLIQNEKYGVIDSNGKMIVKNEYKNIVIPNPTKAVFICTKGDGNTVILNDNEEKILEEYKNVQPINLNSTISNLPYEKSVLKYEDNGKFGLIDFSGKVIAKAEYEEISSVKYKEGEIIAKKNGKYGVLNNKGIILIPFEYDYIEGDKYYKGRNYLNSGYIVKKTTSEGYRYGYYNCKWQSILDTEYTSVSRILDIDSEDVYLIVSKNGQYGVTKNKDAFINFVYQGIEYNKDTNLYVVQRSGQYGVLDSKGKFIIPIEYKGIRFNGTYILAKSYTEDVYYDKDGKKVNNDYTAMIEAKEANSFVTINKKNLYGIANENYEEKVKNEYLYIEYVFDNYFVAYKEGQGLGVIDKDGEVFIDFKYDVLSKIGEKKLLKGVDMKNNTTDIFSEKLENIASLKDANLDMHDNYIELYNYEKTEFITNAGEIKTAKEMFTENKLFAIYTNGKWGFEDRDENIKVEAVYDYVTEFNRFGYAGIKQNDKWGVIDDSGKIICDPTYEFDEDEGLVRPEFIGKFFKTYSENNEIYYTDEV